MYAYIPEIGGRFFEVVGAPSTTTANFRDPPPPLSAKEPEPHCQHSGHKRITSRATVDGALAWD